MKNIFKKHNESEGSINAEIKILQKQINSLSKRVWQLENPIIFKRGDKLIYNYEYSSKEKECEFVAVKGVSTFIGLYCYNCLVLFGDTLKEVNSYNLRFK